MDQYYRLYRRPNHHVYSSRLQTQSPLHQRWSHFLTEQLTILKTRPVTDRLQVQTHLRRDHLLCLCFQWNTWVRQNLHYFGPLQASYHGHRRHRC